MEFANNYEPEEKSSNHEPNATSVERTVSPTSVQDKTADSSHGKKSTPASPLPAAVQALRTMDKIISMEKETFRFLKLLGEGVSGKVLLSKRAGHDLLYAIKFVSVLEPFAETEFKIHHYLSGAPQIVPLLGYYRTDSHVASVMPYYRHGDLYNFIAAGEGSPAPGSFFHDRTAANLIRNMCVSIQSLHHRGVAHFDIKPENFLCSGKPTSSRKNNLWLCDFGYAARATYQDRVNDGRVRGSTGYISPECTRGINCGPAADIWSMAAVAHVLLTGHVPFVYEFDQAILAYQRQALPMALDPREKHRFVLTARACDFMRRCFSYDTDERMTIDEALTHPWLAWDASSPTP